ncbi:acetoacetate-CoA ligase [Colletotrichum graminicola]|uniref:Acetoacetate-CoA ligase n=1 Tax=Colletotrichum graminicola (strain M1.001 / M2 / FGSC 10212) TaxID=645133 RepID=E3Q2H8_COLGM|nr:acetoacetate-CoA ligase [Colletotrichum graminicola M1.001]EFQ25279.1 acetoacetate-CoA ligase [Colletotrichum graminicola M1.001]WDK15071.1 acetoacetate-CoA ligase [Colletotrichum graminicola]
MTITGVTRNELWRHPDPTATPMWAFLLRVNSKYGLKLADYPGLYKWSIENVAEFWEEVWHFVGITASKPFDKVLPLNAPMYPRPDFFEGSRLNFAENLLFPANAAVDPTAVATITTTELGLPVSTTWAELRDAVRRCSAGLRARGVRSGDIVAGFVSNHVQAVVASLAAASIGAIWTGISPDNGISAVLDRLAQIGPKVLFADNGTVYNGKEWSSTEKTEEIVRVLMQNGLELVVVINNVGCDLGMDGLTATGVVAEEYDSFLQSAPDVPLKFEQLPPSHPLYILYSSGTTGLPKAIVHTALGTLIQHKKEHALHSSLDSSSVLLYFTTTSWMMWHWSLSALAVGATIVLYSGSPFKPHGHLSLPRLLSDLRVTHFGTSAAYLITLEANAVYPVNEPGIDLSALEAIYSTASPLPPSTFSFVYKAFPSKVNLASITGGTDIISLFGAPCPLLPVRVGEIQCAGLGMAIHAVDSLSGEPLTDPSHPGDLVCTAPFPCQPLTFFGTGGDEKYKAAYFERFSNICGAKGAVWHHGDFVKIPNPATGSLVMLGRSDGVLKPAGVRFGSAEIYNVLAHFFASEVEDAVCVGRRRATDVDETVCLFVVSAAGRQFDDELRAKIRSVIKRELSPRHVPGVIEEAGGGIPKTGNGKKIEVAVKQILSGMDIKTNASVANPEALEWFRTWAASH